jgi:hypothetical protein
MRRIDDILGSLNCLPDSEPERASASAASGSDAGACPICKGIGWILLDVRPGDPDFNRPVPCRCTEARMAGERLRELRKLSNLGALELMTFDTFIADGVGVSEVVRSISTKPTTAAVLQTSTDSWCCLAGR